MTRMQQDWWLHNVRGAASVCNWSLCACGGVPVAVPWQELGSMPDADALDIERVRKRAVALKQALWASRATRQSLPC